MDFRVHGQEIRHRPLAIKIRVRAHGLSRCGNYFRRKIFMSTSVTIDPVRISIPKPDAPSSFSPLRFLMPEVEWAAGKHSWGVLRSDNFSMFHRPKKVIFTQTSEKNAPVSHHFRSHHLHVVQNFRHRARNKSAIS